MAAAASESGPFPKRLTAWIVAIAALCLVGSLLSLFMSEPPSDKSAGANSKSPSAVGHRAFVDLLRESGIPVIVSRHSGPRDASLLVVIEPLLTEIGPKGADLARRILNADCPTLLVLPKWKAYVDEGNPPALRYVSRMTPGEVGEVLRAVDPLARTVAVAEERVELVSNVLGAVIADPDLTHPQLVSASDWSPVMRAAAGFLLAERDDEPNTVAVLADPDLIANHGLHRGPNAGIALEMVRRLRSDERPVVIDETFHALAVPASFWSQLFTFPFSCATAQAALAAALLLWAGIRRFGAPEPPPPPFEPGKRFLIDHVARLLESGQHHGDTLIRYASLTVEDAARRLHAGSAGGPRDARAFLNGVEKRKQMTESIAALEAQASELAGKHAKDQRATLEMADRLARWKQEIVDGPDVRTGARS